MDKKTKVEILASDLNAITNRLKGFGNLSKIPQIEIDLLLSKIQNLYEEIYQLGKNVKEDDSFDQAVNKENINNMNLQITHSSDFELMEEPVKETKPIVILQNENKPVQERISGGLENKPDEVTSNNLNQTANKQPKEIKHGHEILADKFTAQPSLHESIAKNKVVSDLSSKLQSKPIKDIQHSIGLNEKFLFIKELFGGDSSLYNETIIKLNDASGYEAAMQFIYNNFTWDLDSEITSKLIDLVKRKHGN